MLASVPTNHNKKKTQHMFDMCHMFSSVYQPTMATTKFVSYGLVCVHMLSTNHVEHNICSHIFIWFSSFQSNMLKTTCVCICFEPTMTKLLMFSCFLMFFNQPTQIQNVSICVQMFRSVMMFPNQLFSTITYVSICVHMFTCAAQTTLTTTTHVVTIIVIVAKFSHLNVTGVSSVWYNV